MIHLFFFGKSQTITGSSLSNVRICCFSSSNMILCQLNIYWVSLETIWRHHVEDFHCFLKQLIKKIISRLIMNRNIRPAASISSTLSLVSSCGRLLSLFFLALAPEDDVLVANLKSSGFLLVCFQLGKRLSAQSQWQSYWLVTQRSDLSLICAY